jgi:hypothetical protein
LQLLLSTSPVTEYLAASFWQPSYPELACLLFVTPDDKKTENYKPAPGANDKPTVATGTVSTRITTITKTGSDSGSGSGSGASKGRRVHTGSNTVQVKTTGNDSSFYSKKPAQLCCHALEKYNLLATSLKLC